MDLKGKKVFITGAARRLGWEVARHLIAAGCRVTAHYNHSKMQAEELQKQTGCRLFQADFSSIDINALRSRLDQEVGIVDIFISNASSFQKCEFESINEDLWDQEISINLKVPFFLSQHFGIRMKRKGSGKIIHMSDIAAERAYLPYIPYSIAKAGVVAMTAALARKLAPEVQVNSIAPGTILFVEDLSEEDRKKILKRIPAGRTGTVEEFLGTVDFLLSDVDYITGQTLVLDGGRSLTW
jgi:pteridine reductase